MEAGKRCITVLSAAAVLSLLWGCDQEVPTVVDERELGPELDLAASSEGREESYDWYEGVAPTPAQMAAAISPSATLDHLTASSFTGAPEQAAVFLTPLQGFPTEGTRYLVLSSGIAALTPGVATTFVSHSVGGPSLPAGAPLASPNGLASFDVASFTVSFSLPETVADLSFDWKFGTEENPSFTSSFPDYFRADVFTPATNGQPQNIAVLLNARPVTVTNAAPFSNAVTGSSGSPGPPFPTPNDVVYNAVTRETQKASIDLSNFAGQNVTIQFRVADVNDAILNSAAFIDNLTIGCRLNVTRLSQGKPDWAGDMYDFDPNLKIKDLGCALTSLSMALNLAGIENNPGNLNEFMIDNEGYNDAGWVRWDRTITERSAETLRYNAVSANTVQELGNLICRTGAPVILRVEYTEGCTTGGVCVHYVLATGFEQGRIRIADPGFGDRTFLDDPAYNNEFAPRGFVGDPPGSSSISLDIPGAQLLITDASGRKTGIDAATGGEIEEIPQSAHYIDNLADDVTGEPATSQAQP